MAMIQTGTISQSLSQANHTTFVYRFLTAIAEISGCIPFWASVAFMRAKSDKQTGCV
ncbi:hypothetical protein [Snodgrassella communis]|uniref:hypothetical protein n=1 Tax=Snodgrassella communis TaxID=2946699 RepID=UPI001EF58982|nr:hypothetical protein [Snodgrassella communis]